MKGRINTGEESFHAHGRVQQKQKSAPFLAAFPMHLVKIVVSIFGEMDPLLSHLWIKRSVFKGSNNKRLIQGGRDGWGIALPGAPPTPPPHLPCISLQQPYSNIPPRPECQLCQWPGLYAQTSLWFACEPSASPETVSERARQTRWCYGSGLCR